MALQRTFSLLLLLLLTLLELGLSSYGDENRMYQRFVQQHVDSKVANRNESYCDLLMQRRKMTSRYCRYFNTFIHEDIWKVINICSTTKIRCRNGEMNCHESVVNATDCTLIAGFKAPDCRYWAMTGTRRVVIACEGQLLGEALKTWKYILAKRGLYLYNLASVLCLDLIRSRNDTRNSLLLFPNFRITVRSQSINNVLDD